MIQKRNMDYDYDSLNYYKGHPSTHNHHHFFLSGIIFSAVVRVHFVWYFYFFKKNNVHQWVCAYNRFGRESDARNGNIIIITSFPQVFVSQSLCCVCAGGQWIMDGVMVEDAQRTFLTPCLPIFLRKEEKMHIIPGHCLGLWPYKKL